MKNYVIAFLVVCLVVVGTFFYKVSKAPTLNGFPIEQPAPKNNGGEPPFYLFIFFSRNNCQNCLEAIRVLNELPSPFVVTGIVPVEELENEADLRGTTGASFKLVSFKESYKKFNPYYAPTLLGVSGKGRILFVLPGVPGQEEYLNNFLVEFYGKSIELLIHDTGKLMK